MIDVSKVKYLHYCWVGLGVPAWIEESGLERKWDCEPFDRNMLTT